MCNVWSKNAQDEFASHLGNKKHGNNCLAVMKRADILEYYNEGITVMLRILYNTSIQRVSCISHK